MSWRDKARPIIEAVIEANKGRPLNDIRKALRDAFPWGPRQYHPYKIWLDECRLQLGLQPKKPTPSESRRIKQVKPCDGQGELFQ